MFAGYIWLLKKNNGEILKTKLQMELKRNSKVKFFLILSQLHIPYKIEAPQEPALN